MTTISTHEASIARFDSSTEWKMSKVHMLVDAIHASSQVCFPCSFKVKLSISFVYITKSFTRVIIFSMPIMSSLS